MAHDRQDFVWSDYSLGKCEKHGVAPEEAEYVVVNARKPYPMLHREGTWIVQGQTFQGRWIRVVYFLDPMDRIVVIHAQPLEGKRQRRRRRTSR